MSIKVRTVPATNGVAWLKQALQLFLSAPHYLLLPMFIFSILLAFVTTIAPLGMLVAILVPAFSLQLFLMTEQIAQQQRHARLGFLPSYINSLNLIRDNWQPLLLVGIIYALTNLLIYSFLSYLISDFLTALNQLALTDKTTEELQIIINQLFIQHISGKQLLLLFAGFLLLTAMQNYLILTAIILVKTKCSILQGLFYTWYLVYKNWAAILLFVLSIFAVMLLIILLTYIAAVLQPIALFLLFGLAAVSFCIYYVCLNDCLIID